MTRIIRRMATSGPVSSVRRGTRWLIRKHVRALVIPVVVSLLVSSLPVSSGTTQSVYLKTTAPTQQSQSFAVHLYGTISKTVTSIGSWMASFIETEAVTPRTYQPVAAYLTPAPPFIDAPTSLQVTAASSTSISLSWTAPITGPVDHYVLERSEDIDGPFLPVANVIGATIKNDTTVTNLHAYLYRVRAVSTTGAISPASNMTLGTAISFLLSSLAGQEIRAQHFHDVRTAINLVRPLANLGTMTWARANLSGLEVKADDVNEMRSALDAALTALAIPVTAYTDPTLNVGANGTLIKAIHIEQLQARSTKGTSASSGPIDSDSSTARLDPLNETGGGGENPLSRNFNWNLPLLSLPGRAGLDLGLTLSYNSLVWTKIGANAISFDNDHGFPGPGFRLGFPVIQPRYFNSEVGTQAYLLITPDGSRTELRQVGTSNFYEAADSSHLVLDESVNPMILRTTDGTQLSYALHGDELQCTQIKDRNGNFITVSYNAAGRVNTITDTLNRVITFNYVNGWLMSITQSWKQHLQTPVTHYWARFEYTHSTPLDFNFGSMAVFGAADNSQITTLSKVTLADDSRFEFSYTSWGQVWKVTNFAADNSVLNYRTYDLPQTAALVHNDCPRFTVRKDWAKYWNGDTDGTTAANEEVATATFIVPVSDSWTMPDNTAASGVRAQVTTPDGTLNKIYFVGTAGTDSGWKRGLPALVETHSGGQWKRKVMTTWTQDDETNPYILNPRVKETNVYDPEGNRARAEITYQQFDLGNGMSCHLPGDVFEYAANASTKLRSTRTTYNMTAPYKDRRILGLVSVKELFEGDVTGTLKSKVSLFYDNENGSTSIAGTDAPVQHDNTSYTASFVTGRGNLSSAKRFNVDNLAEFTTTQIKYNTAGALVSSKDASNHETTISYADSFSDGTPRNTLAYPTKITDPDTFESTNKYDFDFGAVTSQRTPAPNETTNVLEALRPQQILTYDSIGRLERITNSVNSALTRLEYPNTNRVDTFTTIAEGQGEAQSLQIADGFGRVVATAKEHTATTFSGQQLVYDQMGRVFKTSNPTETTASGHPSAWSAVGDDASVGWVYTQQTYDWKGRPLRTTNQDSTYSEASYSGCGCAGGAVVTLTDEGTIDAEIAKRRQQKIYSDVLGRTVKTEVFNWQGGTVYSATVNTYNARDQVTQVRQYAGAEGSGTYQDTIVTYDGYGRLKTRHVPEQNVGTATIWDYNVDDTIQKITDARGASQSFAYNNRHLVTGKTYAWPGGGAIPNPVSYTYDAAGNRKFMTDGTGTLEYHFNQLSRIDWEERTFTGLPGSVYRLSYGYNLSGQLTSLTEPSQFGSSVSYSYDVSGRLSEVTGSGFAGGVTQLASALKYRASGVLSEMLYGNGLKLNISFNSRLQINNYQVKVPGSPVGEGERARTDYEYNADGKIKSTIDYTNQGFNRSYGYDHVGRLSGAASSNSAYSLALSYDQFGNLIERRTFSWRAFHVFDSQYQNNRSVQPSIRVPPDAPEPSTWIYDADGRLTHDHNKEYTYDAAGEKTRVFETTDVAPTLVKKLWIYQDYDANGARAKRIEQEQSNSGPFHIVTSYYLRSSVLNGKVITELNEVGARRETNVYANDTHLAQQKDNQVRWQHIDPLTQSHRETNLNGLVESQLEFDPLGNDAPLTDPQPPPMTADYEYVGNYGGNGNPYDGASGCMVDGQQIPCSTFIQLVTFGTGRGMGQSNGPAGAVSIASYVWVDEWEDVETPAGTATQGANLEISASVTTQIRNVGRFVAVSQSRPTNGTPAKPQQSEVRLTKKEYDTLREHIVNALKAKKCRDFIDTLVSYNQGGIYHRSGPVLYDSQEHMPAFADYIYTSANGGIFWRPEHGGQVGPKFWLGPKISFDLNTEMYAGILAHLLIHSVTRGSDDQLDKDLRDLQIVPIGRDGKPLPFPTGVKDGKPYNDWSGYWDAALKNACFPKP